MKSQKATSSSLVPEDAIAVGHYSLFMVPVGTRRARTAVGEVKRIKARVYDTQGTQVHACIRASRTYDERGHKHGPLYTRKSCMHRRRCRSLARPLVRVREVKFIAFSYALHHWPPLHLCTSLPRPCHRPRTVPRCSTVSVKPSRIPSARCIWVAVLT